MRGHLSVAMADPLNKTIIEKIERATRCVVNAYVCNATAISEGIDRLYSSRMKTIEGVDPVNAAKQVRYLNKLLYIAALRGSSDIHVEPGEAEVVVRMRINGRMRKIDTFGLDRLKPLINVIKTSSRLDITINHKPQDGSFTRAL